MNISELFIRRPIMTTLVMFGIVIFGVFAYRLLPVSDLPNVDYPTIQVMASLPGASPETMASAVATPLERQFSTIAGLDTMTSTSSLGNSNVTLQFDLSRNIDAAAQDVQAMITAAGGQLPTGMPNPPTFRKVNPAEQPVIYLAVYSDVLPIYQVDEYAETMMAERISMISGVAQVQVYGARKYAVRAQLDPKKLAADNVGLDEVATAIRSANVNLPVGTLNGTHKAFTVQANGQLMDAAAYRPLIVAYRNGAPVRLDQLGQVINGVQEDKVTNWYDGHEAMVLAVQRQPGTNTVEVVKDVRDLLPKFEQEIPPSIHLGILSDRAQDIKASIHDVKFTLDLAIGLVILVIFLFLRNLSATIIPSLALPMAIIGTFSVMYLMGYTLDNLSLMALVLSVGFVVDDAIVMLENIVRHVEMGKTVWEAALDGSKEISFTILSMTLSLTAVFIPILFMSGMIGRLLHEFAVVIMVAILVSGFVSLTLTPMLCSRFIRSHRNERHSRAYEAGETAWNWVAHVYDWSLKGVLRHRLATLLASLALLAVTGYLFVIIPKGFLPSEDTGNIFGFTLAQQGISYSSMTAHQRAIANICAKDPNIASMMSFSGVGGPSPGGNGGMVFMHLKPHPERKLTTDQVISELRPKLFSVPGILAYLQNPPPIQIGGQLTRGLYQYTLQSPNTSELYQQSQAFLGQMARLPDLQDVNSDLQMANPQANVVIDRDKAATLSVTPAQIETALSIAFGDNQISTIYAPQDEYWVVAELLPKYQESPADLSELYVRSSNGRLVPLSAVAKVTENLGPLAVNHTGQLPSVTISFNLKPGISLGQGVSEVEQLAHKALPATVTTNFQGTAQQFEQSIGSLGFLLIITIVVIYILLGVLYESFIHPITILSGLPSAGLGALGCLMLFKMGLDLYGFVGLIMLIGIVKKNAIMMIDFALEAERKEGKSTVDAIYEGCLVRFRPIMMTTVAAFMGTLPIALGYGSGGRARQPLGLAVVGGLLISQLITLYITPVYYTYLDSFSKFITRLFGGGKREPVGEADQMVLAGGSNGTAEPQSAGRL
ncbi:MAG TPA: efflux RND transporter permease subunit [Terriglobia bacterium]|nr:efflux RND transporter permease subunit [Terriglobia bacterium]